MAFAELPASQVSETAASPPCSNRSSSWKWPWQEFEAPSKNGVESSASVEPGTQTLMRLVSPRASTRRVDIPVILRTQCWISVDVYPSRPPGSANRVSSQAYIPSSNPWPVIDHRFLVNSRHGFQTRSRKRVGGIAGAVYSH